ncbi:3-ketoacyl-CoA synthase 19 [Linum grandiflorum]
MTITHNINPKMEIHIVLVVILTIPLILHQLLKFMQKSSCYLLAYQCYKPPDELKLSTENSIKIILRNPNLGLEEYRFLLKTISRSGIGEETYCSRNFLDGREMFPTFLDSVREIEDAAFSILDNLFAKSKISPKQIDIVITTASLFAPSPTLSGRIVNRYKMKEDVKTFSLSGMGCSSSVVAIDMVRHMFKRMERGRRSFAVVVAMEATAAQWYSGREKSMMLSNVLFRAGGSCLLLTNRSEGRAVLKLDELVRTHLSTDAAYGCAIHVEDDEGFLGARLSKDLPKVVMQGIAQNFKTLLPKALPLYEIIRFSIVRNWPKTKLMSRIRTPYTSSLKPPPIINMKSGHFRLHYLLVIPRRGDNRDGTAGIQHFCVHAGGKAVIEGFGNRFGLEEYDMEPSRMTLHRFGNTSCSSLWYVLSYMEAKRRLKKGDKVLMVGLGAGFMCNTCTWTVEKDWSMVGDDDQDKDNVWSDCVDGYPVDAMLANSYAEKFNWILEDWVSFVRFDRVKWFGSCC